MFHAELSSHCLSLEMMQRARSQRRCQRSHPHAISQPPGARRFSCFLDVCLRRKHPLRIPALNSMHRRADIQRAVRPRHPRRDGGETARRPGAQGASISFKATVSTAVHRSFSASAPRGDGRCLAWMDGGSLPRTHFMTFHFHHLPRASHRRRQ